MLRTLICGIGLIAIVSANDSDAVTQAFTRAGEKVVELGRVVKTSVGERVVYDGKLSLG
jgi:phosphoribosylformylglycinamidine cyclo-ligase